MININKAIKNKNLGNSEIGFGENRKVEESKRILQTDDRSKQPDTNIKDKTNDQNQPKNNKKLSPSDKKSYSITVNTYDEDITIKLLHNSKPCYIFSYISP